MTRAVAIRPDSAAAMRRAARWLAPVAAVGAAAAVAALAAAPAAVPVAVRGKVEDLVVELVAAYPHDPEAFTQGLVWADGGLYESTGLYGTSSLRRVELATGKVARRADLAGDLFGEGLALIPGAGGGRLVQLTWREGLALVWTAGEFARRETHTFDGEGWGLAYDGERLIQSDGSATLTFRDPRTFAATGTLAVTLAGRPLAALNELEFADGALWANVFLSPNLVRIDPGTGEVTAVVDASALVERIGARPEAVLNGIAWIPERKSFLLTGKLWPELFEVRFVPRGGGVPGG